MIYFDFQEPKQIEKHPELTGKRKGQDETNNNSNPKHTLNK